MGAGKGKSHRAGSYQPQPYYGRIDDPRPLTGMDPRLLAATDDRSGVPLAAEDERMVRRAAHRYQESMGWIRDAVEATKPDKDLIVSIAADALQNFRDDEPPMEGEHISVRMTQWMVRDRFVDFARILDAAASGDDVIAIAKRRVKRAYAPIVLR